mmetsp:Transcript_2046/g.6218  ORF Transcript_2046/g.6218 Transcript_2046/m.6218 type:complete len:80 (-) Transcript_2046:92-331(-)
MSGGGRARSEDGGNRDVDRAMSLWRKWDGGESRRKRFSGTEEEIRSRLKLTRWWWWWRDRAKPQCEDMIESQQQRKVNK